LKYPDVDFVKLVDDTRAHVFSHLDDLKLYEQAKETVVALHEQGIKLALVSSSSRKLLEKGLSLYGLEKYFSSIISGDDITKHKPDPEAFNQTFEAIDALPEETLIIGDAKTDIIVGKTTNTITCLFTPEDNRMFYDFEVLRATLPDHIITSQKELIDIILTTNQQS
jgi:pyrophosphatase PpaX